MKSYQTARRICTFLEILGWISVVYGLGLAVVLGESYAPYSSPGAAFAVVLPGLIIAVVGLFYVGGVQGWRSTVDTAEFTQQLLKVARDQLDVSRQALEGGPNVFEGYGDSLRTGEEETRHTASFSDLTGKDWREDPPREQLLTKSGTRLEEVQYRQNVILKKEDVYLVGEKRFDTLEAAEAEIDAVILQNFRPPSGL